MNFFIISAASLVLSACFAQPQNIPRDAEYVGSWKHGRWVSCDNNTPMNCNIYTTNGNLYASGEYALEQIESMCSSGFTSVILPFRGAYLTPVNVQAARGGYSLHSASNQNDLANAISELAISSFGTEATSIEISNLDDCGDGTYQVIFGSNEGISGTIWAFKYFLLPTSPE